MREVHESADGESGIQTFVRNQVRGVDHWGRRVRGFRVQGAWVNDGMLVKLVRWSDLHSGQPYLGSFSLPLLLNPWTIMTLMLRP